VIIGLAFETKYLTTCALDCLELFCVYFYAISAIYASAKLIIFVRGYERLTDFLLVFSQLYFALVPALA